jgi:molecular chaperone GrpE
MALPEDEAKQVLESEQETSQNEVLDQVEVDSGYESLGDEALTTALSEAEKFKDLALRAEAEMQNLQRRTARDVENAHKFGVEKFVQNMLPVLDSLEKAIEATGDNVDSIAEGVRLCHKLMVSRLIPMSTRACRSLRILTWNPTRYLRLSRRAAS